MENIKSTKVDMELLEQNKDKIVKYLNLINEESHKSRLENFSKEQIDDLYGLGYNLYQAENFDQAMSIFSILSLFDPYESKYTLAIAGCLMGKKMYEKAFEVYQMAFVLDSLNNPEPIYNSAICLIKLGRKEDALEVLTLADVCDREGNERHDKYKAKCQELYTMLDLGRKNKMSM